MIDSALPVPEQEAGKAVFKTMRMQSFQQFAEIFLYAELFQFTPYFLIRIAAPIVHQPGKRTDMDEQPLIHLCPHFRSGIAAVHQFPAALQHDQRALKSVRLEGIDQALPRSMLYIIQENLRNHSSLSAGFQIPENKINVFIDREFFISC